MVIANTVNLLVYLFNYITLIELIFDFNVSKLKAMIIK